VRLPEVGAQPNLNTCRASGLRDLGNRIRACNWPLASACTASLLNALFRLPKLRADKQSARRFSVVGAGAWHDACRALLGALLHGEGLVAIPLSGYQGVLRGLQWATLDILHPEQPGFGPEKRESRAF